jgi:hypothetical protein
VSGAAGGPELAARRPPAELRALVLHALARAPAWTITAAAGVVYLIVAPASADLAAATYRSELFGREGFTLWDNGWYGGHHLPAYSVLAPALGWLVGPRLLATLSLVAVVALFAPLVSGRFAPAAVRVAAIWLAIGAAIALLSCRVAFDLGLAIGTGALLVAARGHRGWAIVLSLLCGLASPVAGGFLALIAIVWWLSLGPARDVLWLAVAALVPAALLALAFPEGGTQPFVASAFYPAVAGVLALAALAPAGGSAGVRALRAGALVYALALIGAFVLHTPVGGNVDRLGALAAGPLGALAIIGQPSALRGAAGAAARRRVWALALLSPALLYWQANAPVADFTSAEGDPAVNASYYAPLLSELQRLGVGYGARPARVEVVPSVDHWEAQFVAQRVAIARGWERQLDGRRNALFYSGAPLDAARYRAWLTDEAISLVALPDAPLDYSGTDEAQLIRAGPPAYLREIWRSAHWRLFAVLGAAPLAQAPAQLERLGHSSFELLAPRAGSYTVRVRFTPYWRPAGPAGCVGRGAEDWTLVRVPRAGRYRVVVGFSFARVLASGPRCA